jgi:hypothetical protein
MQRTVAVIEKRTGQVIGALPIDLAEYDHKKPHRMGRERILSGSKFS